MSLKDNAESDDDLPSNRTISSDVQASTINMFACCSIPIRSFHITWVIFFCCLFPWFITANLFKAISDDFELTLAGSLSITSTFVFHWMIAYLCPKLGSRKTYIIVSIICLLYYMSYIFGNCRNIICCI